MLAAAIQERVNEGRTHFPAVPPEELRRVEGDHLLRTEVAADFVQLMTSAREQLRLDQAGPPGRDSDSARQVTATGSAPPTASTARELRIWTSLFPQYYRATESEREAASGGTTWLHQWLVANAQRFHFHPLASEEWHWDHR